MAVTLEGSCHCGAVRFTVESATPVPYQRCYCSICRKQQGGGGYAINLGADARTLKVEGREHIGIYHARLRAAGQPTQTSAAERHFCRKCGSALWLFDPGWPELLHPFASAIDSELPSAPETTHLMLAYKPAWVAVEQTPGDLTFEEYPEESIADWHARHHLTR